MSEIMAKIAARNIGADLRGGRRRRLPLADLAAICVLDAGNGAGHARIMAGPQAHWAKLAFERYFLASRRRGLVSV